MPTLILSPSYNSDSRILRRAAQKLGWQSFRFEGHDLPSWFESGDDRNAIYCTVPKAFDVARRLNSWFLGCSAAWLADLPALFSKRKVQLLELKDALSIRDRCFIKPALGKSFAAAVRTGPMLTSDAARLPPDLLVQVSEVVEWQTEYRCFVTNRDVATLAPYRRGDLTFSSHASPLQGPLHEMESAREFARSVVRAVPCPGAFVLDVGIIQGRGWAVVEPNECWGAGIYGCMPAKVLEVLLAATVNRRIAATRDPKWEYSTHYFHACPHMKPPL